MVVTRRKAQLAAPAAASAGAGKPDQPNHYHRHHHGSAVQQPSDLTAIVHFSFPDIEKPVGEQGIRPCSPSFEQPHAVSMATLHKGHHAGDELHDHQASSDNSHSLSPAQSLCDQTQTACTASSTHAVPSSPLITGLTSDEVEEWRRFPYIIRGYRKGGDHWSCFKSAFAMHNETLNAWTMVASLVAGIWLCCWALRTARPLSAADASPFIVLLLGQAVHTPASVSYHLCMPISAEVANFCRRLDLSLVLVMNTAATWAFSYFTLGLYGSVLLTSLTAAAAAAGIQVLMGHKPGQQVDRARLLRVIFVTALGYYVPITYRGLCAGVSWLFNGGAAAGEALPIALVALILTVACHGCGALVYATHWPQCWWPGVFDFWAHSHVLMHIFLFVCYNFGYTYLVHLHSQQQLGAWPPAWPAAAS